MIYRSVFSLCVIFISSLGIAQIQYYKVVTINKDTTRLIEHQTKSYVIIFSNNNSCRSCFRPLNSPEDHLNNLLKEESYFVRFVCRVPKDSGSRRRQITELISDMPNIANYGNIFFDIYRDEYIYNKQTNEGLFGEFQINETPAIVLYRPNLPIEKFNYHVIVEYFKRNSFFSLEKMIEFRDNLKN